MNMDDSECDTYNMCSMMAGGMDMGGMDMVMTFGDWDQYKLKFLFYTWDITTKTQFAFTWFAVIAATILYKGVNYFLILIEEDMRSVMLTGHPLKSKYEEFDEPINKNTGSSASLMNKEPDSGVLQRLRIKHAVFQGLNYGMALMLMLVAMTYNPTLFLGLMIGYGIGDYIFSFHVIKTKFKSVGEQTECH